MSQTLAWFSVALRLNVDLNKDLLSLVGGSADIGEFDWLSPPEEILRCDRGGFQDMFDDMLGVANTTQCS